MTFLLDHLIAVVVGTVLLGALLVLQQRDQLSAVEASQRYRSQALAAEMTTSLEREVENIRSRAETERAFQIVDGDAVAPGAPTYRFRLRQATGTDGGRYTSEFSFPTVAPFNSLDPSGVMVVTYRVEPMGETARIDGRDRPLYRSTRYEYHRGGGLKQTTVHERLVDVDVTVLTDEGEVAEANELSLSPPRVHLELAFAPELVGAASSDQAAPAATSTRYARSVRVPAASAPAGTDPIDTSAPGGILTPGS